MSAEFSLCAHFRPCHLTASAEIMLSLVVAEEEHLPWLIGNLGTKGVRAKLWAFDSFCGLPAKKDIRDQHPRWHEGSLAMGVEEFKKMCLKKGIPASEFIVVPGFYEQSLGDGPDKNFPKDICLAYIDCDLYSSTAAVLDFLTKRLKHGMIIAFDDYYCWSATQVSGERKACHEYFRNNKDWALLPFVQYGWHGMSFVVENRKLHGECSVGY